LPKRLQQTHPQGKVCPISTKAQLRRKPRNGPFLRWAGGKRRLVPLIAELVCDQFDEDEGFFIDPFVGGGAIPFGMIDLGNMNPSRIRISDINKSLISAYRFVQSRDKVFYQELQKIQERFDSEDGEAVYLQLRKEFNLNLDDDDSFQAARFVGLNVTSFNGLWRENSVGEYNVPYGKIQQPLIYDIEGLDECARKLDGMKITVQTFDEAIAEVNSSDFVFFDPPYIPISDSSSFAAYHGGGFGLAEHVQLSNEILRLVEIGAEVVLCNSYCPASVDIYQDCGLFLYKHFVGRSIAADGQRRENVEELIATSTPISNEILEEFFVEEVKRST